MRIAHVSDAFMPRLGGIERQVHDLALRQLAAGHEVGPCGQGHDLDQVFGADPPGLGLR